ncbi:MAG: cysteine synthase A [Tenericutes bacterium GWF2_57_13]|nr:MAG: cysteine synthase A [Tenericutes bacterium GWF2_57_13]
MTIHDDITRLIGNTPLVRLARIEAAYGVSAKLIAKLEKQNPGGSVKDRIARAMIETAERDGLLEKGATIVEATSGNTGIGLAMVGAAKGYRMVFTMSEAMSLERRSLLRAYGAELVLTDASLGMKGAIAEARRIHAETPGSFLPLQFENAANPITHYATTGPEIFRETDGTVDVFVAGVGTGGTVSGVGRYLKEQKPSVRIVAVEPEKSPVLSGGAPAPHMIQGISAGFIPRNYDGTVVDAIATVSNEDAITFARALASVEGILSGISCGAALAVAVRIGKDPAYAGKTIVILLPDTGERYLSTILFK